MKILRLASYPLYLKDTGKRFTYDKYGWDVDEDNNFVENEKEQYWIEYIKVRYHEDDISISQIASSSA